MEKINLSFTKAYKEVIKHRNKCKYWGKKFCLECFGNGLHIFTTNLFNELEINKNIDMANRVKEFLRK